MCVDTVDIADAEDGVDSVDAEYGLDSVDRTCPSHVDTDGPHGVVRCPSTRPRPSTLSTVSTLNDRGCEELPSFHRAAPVMPDPEGVLTAEAAHLAHSISPAFTMDRHGQPRCCRRRPHPQIRGGAAAQGNRIRYNWSSWPLVVRGG